MLLLNRLLIELQTIYLAVAEEDVVVIIIIIEDEQLEDEVLDYSTLLDS